MNGNYLKLLVAEHYEFQGYFVQRDVRVGGCYYCDSANMLEFVAVDPETASIVHIELSVDVADSCRLEGRCERKFPVGRQLLPMLFSGIRGPLHIDQVALFLHEVEEKKTEFAGGRVLHLRDFLKDVRARLSRPCHSYATTLEKYPLLHTLQLARAYGE